MGERTILGYDRKCRRCEEWAYFEGDLDTEGRCPSCGAYYGRLVLGEDVPRRKNPEPRLTPAERRAIKAAKLAAKPQKGQYGYRGK